jgi:hypothetical protein
MPDPRFGGIAQDAFLVSVKKRDGSAFISPEVDANFNCLKTTGQFCAGTTKVKP